MQSVTALVQSVGTPFTALYNQIVTFYQYLTMPAQSPFNGLPRTAKLREAIQLRQESASAASGSYDIEHLPFFQLSDEDILLLFRDAFEPELHRLWVASPTLEAASSTPLGDLGPNHDQTPSRFMYGKDFAEVNRSLLGVLALKWIVIRDYERLTRYQNADLKLRRKSFDALREYVLSYLRSSEELYALLVATFANDLGKDVTMLHEVQKYLPPNGQKVNHDEVIYLAAVNHVIEIIDEFPESNPERESLILGLRLGAKLNVSQFAQAENVPGSLSSVMVMQGRPEAFDLKYLEIIFDVAGAQGHNDARCALNLIEPVWSSYYNARDILLEIVRNKVSLRGGYDAMLEQRNRMLVDSGWQSLDITDPTQRALLRLLSMGRVTESTLADHFQEAMNGLQAAVRTDLVNGLMVDGIEDGCAVIPYYAPSLFANALKATQNSTAPQQVAALQAIFRLLARAYQGSKPEPERKAGRIVECYLDFARDTILGEEFAANPEVLDRVPIPDEAYTMPISEWNVFDGKQ
jgi:hypothetical protein